MYVVRPVEMADLPQLTALARRDNQRVHTLPQARAALAQQVERSLAAFAGAAPDAHHVFVLAGADGTLAGTAALLAQVSHFLSFRQDMLRQHSPEPLVTHDVATLMLCADLSGYSQLCGFHAPGRALDASLKSLLGRARLMYAALAPHRFADRFFACLPGPVDRQHASPVWDAIGRHFFRMDLLQAEALLAGQRNGAAIVGLMPHHPVYLALLPAAARAALACVDTRAHGALQMLSREGFQADDYVDLCDGGPVLRANRQALRSWSGSARRRVVPARRAAGGPRYLVCNGRTDGFRAVVASCGEPVQQDSIALTSAQQRLLAIGPGDDVVCVPL